MAKGLKCWKRNIVGWGKRGGGWVYLYKKGMFRDKEDKFVISTSLTGGSNPEDRNNEPFETRKQAFKFAKSYMKKHDRC